MNYQQTEIDVRENTQKFFEPIGFESKSILNTDGYGKLTNLGLVHPPFMVREAKREINFDNQTSVYRIVLQCLKYLQDLVTEGEITPELMFIHDCEKYIIFHTNPFIKYISDTSYNWNLRASDFSEKNNSKLFQDLVNDDNIVVPLPKSFEVDGKNLKKQILEILRGKKRKLPAVPKKLTQFCEHFEKYVLKEPNIGPVQVVNIFTSQLIHSDVVKPNETVKTILHTLTGTVKIDRKEWERLFGNLDLNWTEKEKDKIVAFQDALIEESRRRQKGEFYTPNLLVEAAWSIGYPLFGGKENVYQNMGIYDSCSGTGSLTKPLGSKPLNMWLSTLEWDDLVSSKKVGTNPRAKRFQLDFLNDPLSKYSSPDEQSLFRYIESGKKLICIQNPPWARASSGHKGNSKSRTKVANTLAGEMMKKESSYGDASAQLQTQFFYMTDKLNEKNNIYIGQFSPLAYLASQDFKNFRKKILSKYKFLDGFLFDCKMFDGVSNFPGVFVWWEKTNENIQHTEFDLKVFKQISAEEYIFDGTQKIYNLDNSQSLKDYCKVNEKGLKKIIFPGTTDGNVLRENHKSRMYENSLGWLYADSNCIEKNSTNIGLFSVGFSHGQGVPIIEENVIKCLGYFTYRAIIKTNKFDSKNEYILPSDLDSLNNLNIQSCILSYFLNQNKSRNYDYDFRILNKLIPFGEEVFGQYVETCDLNMLLPNLIEKNKEIFWDETKNVINKLKEIFQKLHNFGIQIEECDLSWKIVKKYIQTNFPDDLELLNLKIKELELKIKNEIYNLVILKK